MILLACVVAEMSFFIDIKKANEGIWTDTLDLGFFCNSFCSYSIKIGNEPVKSMGYGYKNDRFLD